MAFDGIFIHHLTAELSDQLVDGRIDKIHQPERDELVIHIRTRDGLKILFISVDSSIPYFTLTTQKKENPQTPPMFCMLLRKHLSGGKILDIRQIGFERIVAIDIEGHNDFGEIECKSIYIEIMGKHSNIIFVREDLTIIDSIKRITPDMSRVRSLLPGMAYFIIPNDKCAPTASEAELMAAFNRQKEGMPLYKTLYSALEGFSPFLSQWILAKAELDSSLPFTSLTHQDTHKLYETIQETMKMTQPKGYIVTEGDKGARSVYFVDTHMTYQGVEIYDTLADALDRFYARTNRSVKMQQRLTDIRKAIQIKYDRSAAKLIKLKEERNEAEHAERYKIIGELIYANLYQLSKGMNVATLQNYYDEAGGMIDIPLDVRLDPNENAQAYYKKYTKLKTAQNTLEIQIKETEETMIYLDNILTHMETAESASDMTEILTELADQGYIKKKYTKKPTKPAKPVLKTYHSTDGYEILVGKNNYQNDFLTLKVASNKDVWLHTKIIPGSHVIIRTRGEEVPEQTIIEAAKLAAYYSKARLSANVPVDYTYVKYVTKPSGAKPGMVIYTHNRTVFVTPDADFVEALS